MTDKAEDVSAARLFGAVDALRARIRFPFTELEETARAQAMVPLLERHDPQWLRRERDVGAHQSLETILRLARDYVGTAVAQ
jgi:hypothetical protein